MPPLLKQPPARKLYHATERHEETNARERARKEVAWKSWDALYANGQMLPCHLWTFPRTADQTIGDPRPLPYLKDVLSFAMDQAQEHDIIVWTNDDNFLHPELPDALRFHVSVYGVCTAQRCEFIDGIPDYHHPPSYFATEGSAERVGGPHLGRDLFSATKQWLLGAWAEIPDFILGASDFDLCLAALVRLRFGIESSRQNMRETIHPAELPKGYIAHQNHYSNWMRPENVTEAPSQKHNRGLFKQWVSQHSTSLQLDAMGRL